MFVFKAAVLGGGTMGGEIAQVIANADIPVVVKDVEQKFVDHALEKSREVTRSQLDRLVSKEKMTQEQADARLDEVMGLITGTTTYDGFGDVDFVIEAVPERMEIKKSVYRELDEVTPGHAILASNTSSLSITEMGRETLRPGKVVGFHFFFPASVMPLVEIISGEDTSRDTLTTAFNFAQSIRKQPITCKEVPGFVVNRILNSAAGEVWRQQEEKGLSIKKIDEGVAASNVSPMGPFFLIDMLGLDTVLHVAEYLHEEPTGRASTFTRECRSWSRTATWAPSPAATASTRTASRRSRARASRTQRSSPTCSSSSPLSRPASCSRRVSPRSVRSTSG